MERFLKREVVLLLAAFALCSCAVAQRVSSWECPQRFNKAQVFNAALQAGGQNGMKTTASDRESGTMTFSKPIGAGEMVQSVQILEAPNGIIKVQTTAHYANPKSLALAGLHEEIINNFHVYLFQNLNITTPTEQNVRIETTPIF